MSGSITREDLALRFGPHPPTTATAQLEEVARDTLHGSARLLAQICPPGRELALAITALEEALLWATAAINRYPEEA